MLCLVPCPFKIKRINAILCAMKREKIFKKALRIIKKNLRRNKLEERKDMVHVERKQGSMEA